MQYTIEFGGDPQDVTITTSGVAEPAVFTRYLEEFLADARFRPGMAVLIDHSALDARSLSTADLRTIADGVLSRDDLIGASVVAVVASDSLTFGLARMWEAFTATSQLRSRIFYSRDEALAWLRDPASYEGDAIDEA
jgi:hypothetical protein